MEPQEQLQSDQAPAVAEQGPAANGVGPERRREVANWVAANIRPVLHVMVEEASADEPRQEFETRDYQLDAWARLEDARAEGRNRALGNLATGLGKTFVSAVDVLRYREWRAQQDSPTTPKVLYVSHQRDINEQAAGTFESLMPDVEITHFETQKKTLPDADITFATIQSLYSELDRFEPQHYDYIVWDESHHLEARTYKAVRDHFDPRFEHAITATVERADGKDIKEYFGEPLYQKELAEGIAEGWLADVEYHLVFDRALRSKLQAGFNPKSLREIKELFDEKPPREAIARNIEEEIERLGLEDPKTIVFCEDIDEAEEMATLLGGAAYHSKAENRKQTLRDFRAGSLRRITTRDMFNEGVDIPDAELIVFLRSTSSPTIFKQQLGRGLRRAPGKDKVYVLDFVANVERIEHVRKLSKDIEQITEETNERDGAEGGPIPGEEENDETGLREQQEPVVKERDETEKDPIPGEASDKTGLRVHSAHGDFDFDKIAVDLLERWGVLSESRAYSEFNKAEIIELALTLKTESPLTVEEINEFSAAREFPSYSYIRQVFGSISNFQRACGFKVRDLSELNSHTDQSLIELADTVKPGEPLTNKDVNSLARDGKFVSLSAIRSRFGALSAFNAARGLAVLGKHAARAERSTLNSLTDQELIALAVDLSPKIPLSQREIAALSGVGKFVTRDLLIERFGSIVNFQRSCGFIDAGKRSVSRMRSNDEIIELAKSLQPDRPLMAKEMDELSKSGKFAGASSIARRFGSIKAFQKACGFDVGQ